MKSLAILIVILAAPAMADHEVPYNDASVILVPPPEFNNQMGARYLGTFRRVLADHATIKAACTGPNTPNPLACTKFPKDGQRPARPLRVQCTSRTTCPLISTRR